MDQLEKVIQNISSGLIDVAKDALEQVRWFLIAKDCNCCQVMGSFNMNTWKEKKKASRFNFFSPSMINVVCLKIVWIC